MAHRGRSPSLIEALTQRVKPAFEAEKQALAEFAEREMAPPSPPLRPWTCLRRGETTPSAYDFDEECCARTSSAIGVEVFTPPSDFLASR